MQTISHTMPGTGAIGADQLHAAMLAVVETLAADAALPAIVAARAPVSLGAAYADLCDRLGMPAPAIVDAALSAR